MNEYGDVYLPFKSEGEVQIARLLQRNCIRYFYEQPHAVLDRQKVRIWYPDFTLPDYGIVIEYFGREDDRDYASGIRRKERVFRENGLAVLMLRPRDLRGAWPQHILDSIESLLLDRLVRFRLSQVSAEQAASRRYARRIAG